MDSNGFPLSLEGFLSRIVEHEKEIRTEYFDAEDNSEVQEAVDGLVLAAASDFDNFWKIGDGFPESRRWGILVLNILHQLKEILTSVPENISNELAAKLINVSFQAGYEFGVFSKQAEFDNITKARSSDDVKCLLEKAIKFHRNEGRKGKDGDLKKDLLDVYLRNLPQGTTRISWKNLYNAWMTESNERKKTNSKSKKLNSDSKSSHKYSDISEDGKNIYFTKAGKKDSVSIGRFKNIRGEIEKALKKTVTGIDKP